MAAMRVRVSRLVRAKTAAVLEFPGSGKSC